MENNLLKLSLWAIMADKGVSPAAWAKKARISPNVIYNFERGDANSLNHGSLERLARGLGMTVSELLAWTPRSLSARIAVNRKANGWTQKELAQKIGVAPPTVTRWEKHDVAIDDGTIEQLASLFGCSPEYLKDGGHITPEPEPRPMKLTATPLVRWQLQQLHKGPNGEEEWRDVPGVTMSADGK